MVWLACPKIHLLQAVSSPQWPHNKSVEGVAQQGGRHTGPQHGLHVGVPSEQHRELKSVIPVHERPPHNQTLHVEMLFKALICKQRQTHNGSKLRAARVAVLVQVLMNFISQTRASKKQHN